MKKKYALIVDGVVKQIQPYHERGFVEVSMDIFPGMIEKDGAFIVPEPDASLYREMREREYPKIGDQLDAIMKWLATESEFAIPAELKSVAMKCMSVKAKYPKPKEKDEIDG